MNDSAKATGCNACAWLSSTSCPCRARRRRPIVGGRRKGPAYSPQGRFMRPLFRGRSTRLVGALAGVVLLAGAGVAWTQRTRIEAWYCVQRLAGADERGREAWAERA